MCLSIRHYMLSFISRIHYTRFFFTRYNDTFSVEARGRNFSPRASTFICKTIQIMHHRVAYSFWNIGFRSLNSITPYAEFRDLWLDFGEIIILPFYEINQLSAAPPTNTSRNYIVQYCRNIFHVSTNLDLHNTNIPAWKHRIFNRVY